MGWLGTGDNSDVKSKALYPVYDVGDFRRLVLGARSLISSIESSIAQTFGQEFRHLQTTLPPLISPVRVVWEVSHYISELEVDAYPWVHYC